MSAANLSPKEDTFYFPFLPQVLSPLPALSAPQFMHSHVPPISPTPTPPLSYLSRSKSTPSLSLSLLLSLGLASLPTAPHSRVFETVSFLRRELFSFLGVTRDRVTDDGGGGGRGAAGGELTSEEQSVGRADLVLKFVRSRRKKKEECALEKKARGGLN